MLEHQELTERIIGAAITVHRKLGPGFIESVYENAHEIGLKKQGMFVERQLEVSIYYDGVEVGKHRLDMRVARTIVVELKAIKDLDDIHFAIAKSYLRAAQLIHGLILNFAKPTLEAKRVICR